MLIHKRYQILVGTLALIAIIGFLSATSSTKQDSVQELKKNGWGSAEEAFAAACRTLKEYFSAENGGPVVIDSQFRATLHSRSKVWTVKGYASFPDDDHGSYRWTVILDYDGVQDWEVLEKIITPLFATPVSGRLEGVSQGQVELL